MLWLCYALALLDFIGFMQEEMHFSLLFTILGKVCAAALECHRPGGCCSWASICFIAFQSWHHEDNFRRVEATHQADEFYGGILMASHPRCPSTCNSSVLEAGWRLSSLCQPSSSREDGQQNHTRMRFNKVYYGMLRCGVHSLVIGSGTGVVRVVRLVRVFRVLMLGIRRYQTRHVMKRPLGAGWNPTPDLQTWDAADTEWYRHISDFVWLCPFWSFSALLIFVIFVIDFKPIWQSPCSARPF